MLPWRQRRSKELHELRGELSKLIAIFRGCAGLDEFEELPAGISPEDMIAAILDYEAARDGEGNSNKTD